MQIELTESQKVEISLTSEQYCITEMSEKYNVHYNTIYNYCKKHKLKYSLIKTRSAQKIRNPDLRESPSYADLLKERAVVIPDPKRKWERPKAVYSNQSREDLIDKILNDK